MVVLKRACLAGLGVLTLMGCNERDFSANMPATPSDSGSAAAAKPVSTPKAKPDPVPVKVTVPGILIESLSASDLRLQVGESKPAPVTVQPSNAASPLYEMTSSKPSVAEVTAEGIHGTGAGSATITVHALDGSDKTTKFHVIVDAIFEICLIPCLCLGKAAGNGKGKAKGNGDGGGNGDSVDPCGG